MVTTLASNRRILCASPAYLEQAGLIEAPGDLATQRCLVVRENDEDVTLWRFSAPGRDPVTVRIHPIMSSTAGRCRRNARIAPRTQCANDRVPRIA